MSRPIHFEIQADDPERAMKFYAALFDWKFNQFGEHKYWLVATGDKSKPGIDGGLMPRPQSGAPQEMAAVNCYVCTMDVADLDAAVSSALAAGGALALPKMPIPGIGWLAYCKDTEGNIFGMMQPDTNAK